MKRYIYQIFAMQQIQRQAFVRSLYAVSLWQAQNDEGKQNYEGKATDRYAAQKQHWQLQADSYGKLAQAFSGRQTGLENVLGFPAQSAAELSTVEHLINEGQHHTQ